MTQRLSLTQDRLGLLADPGVVTASLPAVFEVTGPGAMTCLQGLLTNDLAQPGDGSLVYGALLTPKGAIVVDYWVLRLPDRFLLLAEPEGQAASVELFRRSLPPRLARVSDRTGMVEALWLHGAGATAALTAAELPVLDAGRAAESGGVLVARPHPQAPFATLVLGPPDDVAPVRDRLLSAGLFPGDPADHEAARILAGWPRLGAEIGERTLVQEVRYDEIGGVSYTKGCYTGQETVARLHFRGHTNRELRGLAWSAPASDPGDAIIDAEGKEIGVVTSLLTLPERALGLGLLRREVEPGSVVTAAGQPASVVALPFGSRPGQG
jgi:tRNA-modifying protein YgfZ